MLFLCWSGNAFWWTDSGIWNWTTTGALIATIVALEVNLKSYSQFLWKASKFIHTFIVLGNNIYNNNWRPMSSGRSQTFLFPQSFKLLKHLENQSSFCITLTAKSRKIMNCHWICVLFIFARQCIKFLEMWKRTDTPTNFRVCCIWWVIAELILDVQINSTGEFCRHTTEIPDGVFQFKLYWIWVLPQQNFQSWFCWKELLKKFPIEVEMLMTSLSHNYVVDV